VDQRGLPGQRRGRLAEHPAVPSDPTTRPKHRAGHPLVVDTNGNGQRDEYVQAGQPLDPEKDMRVMAAFYGVMPSPVDDSIWGQSMDAGSPASASPATWSG